jgi:hypothetical protein
MPDLWRDRLDEIPTTHPPISTGKAWSLQTIRQPTGDRGNTHRVNMDFKPVAKSIIREELRRLQAETGALLKTILDARLPADPSLDDMAQDVLYAMESFRGARTALNRIEAKFTDAFDPVEPTQQT